MIYTVTFNPSLDYVVEVDSFKEGSVNRTSDEKIFAGGKGINVSRVLKNIGYKNTALGFTAGFTGEKLESMLNQQGVKTDFINVDDGLTRINVKINSDYRSEVNGQGPAISDDNISELYDKLHTLLKDGDILILSGSIPKTMPQTIYSDIMKHLSGRNIKIIVDATKDLLMNVLKYKPFLVKPNNIELGEIYGVELNTKEEVVPYAMKLKQQGAQNVLVSMGSEGAVLIDENNEVHMSEPPDGDVVNPVGAGDSMVAGFLAGYMKTSDYKEALRMGLVAGSATAFKDDLANAADIDKVDRDFK